jgi:hypothetical protein
MFGLSAFYPGRTATVTYQLMDCPEPMDNDDQEFVQVEFQLPLHLYELASEAARRRAMALEDYVSVLVCCDIEGTLPLWHKPGVG